MSSSSIGGGQTHSGTLSGAHLGAQQRARASPLEMAAVCPPLRLAQQNDPCCRLPPFTGKFESLFWASVSTMTDSDRRELLYFATGSPVHPHGDHQLPAIL